MTIDNINQGADDNPASAVLEAEAQMATYMAKLLNDDAQQLSALTTQRLLIARRLAVSQLARQQAQTFNQSGNVLHWLGHHVSEYWEQHRTMSAALIFLLMLMTFFAAQQYAAERSLQASDAFLLASDLPPEAYADKGFDTWLEANLD